MARAPIQAKPHSVPVFSPKLESATREALSVFLMQMGLLPDAQAGQLEPLRRCVDDMVDAVFEGAGTSFDLDVTIPVRDHQYAHPARVAEVAMLITKLAGGQRAHARAAGTAALLMNLGYAQMRASILENAGALNPDDLAMTRLHPAAGAAMLEHAGLPAEVIEGIRSHHERCDGSGYPDGLRGKAIPTIARILGAADAYVARLSPRPHRPAMPRDDVDLSMRTDSSDLFDPRILRILLDELPNRYCA